MKTDTERSPSIVTACADVSTRSEICVDASDSSAIEYALSFRVLIDQTPPWKRAHLHRPVPMALSLSAKKMSWFPGCVSGLAIRAAPDALRRKQTCALAVPGGDWAAGLLEPVAAEIARPGTRLPQAKSLSVYSSPSSPPIIFSAQERRVAHDEVHLRPVGLLRVLPGRSGPGSRPCAGSCCIGRRIGSRSIGSRCPASTGDSRSRPPSAPGRGHRG